MASSEYNRKLDNILQVGARIISEQGYERATVRKVARELNMSLAGLYYYLECKEELLYLIQFSLFDSLVNKLKESLRGLDDPERGLYLMVENHVDHFLKHENEFKVCSQELDSLTGEYYEKVYRKRRDYFKLTLELIRRIKREAGDGQLDPRVSTMCLFGMLNWFYMWYDPKKDVSGSSLAEEVARLFLNGFLPRDSANPKSK